jgi:hypothetical protein
MDPFELDEANIPPPHKHGFTTDDLYDIRADPDAIYAPARPDGFADWLLVGEVPGGRSWSCRSRRRWSPGRQARSASTPRGCACRPCTRR